MGKINMVSLCNVTGLCLLAGLAVKTVADYSRYSSVQNSAPFSAWMLMNALYFAAPALLLFLAGMLLQKKRAHTEKTKP